MVDGNGAVLSYQRYTPWGEVRDGTHTLTSIDFTGQRRDDSGLLFSNARSYDPKLARFLSSDPIAPTNNPQSRNRYTYVLNNPIRLIDPTGYCSEHAASESDAVENERCERYSQQLSEYGYAIEHLWDWTSEQLFWILEGTQALLDAAGWNIATFKEHMGIGKRGAINLVYGGYDERYWGLATNNLVGNDTITLYAGALTNRADAMYTIVHELAHVWDFASSSRKSGGLATATGSRGSRSRDANLACPYIDIGCYTARGTPASGYARTNAREDWAESVAAVVLPDYGRWDGPMDKTRKDYVYAQF